MQAVLFFLFKSFITNRFPTQSIRSATYKNITYLNGNTRSFLTIKNKTIINRQPNNDKVELTTIIVL